MMGDTKKKIENPCPKINANFFSRISFWWLRNLFWKRKDRDLKQSDLYDVLPENISESLGDDLEKSWKKEKQEASKRNKKPSLWKAIIRTYGRSFAQHGLSFFILNIVKILQPIMLTLLIRYFNPLSTVSTEEAYMYASGLMLATLLQIIIVRQAHLGSNEIGMRARIACSSLIYRKVLQLVLKLSSKSANQVAGGLVINLLSNDVAKFEVFVLHLQYVWMMPIVMTLITYLIWQQFGIASLAGILFMVIQVTPTQVFTYKMISKLRLKGAVKTDKRVLLIGEIINGIRVIKMYAWEKSFEQLVYAARKYEIDLMLKRFYIRGVRLAFNTFSHRVALFCTILVYVLQNNVISADKIFSTVQYYMLVRSIMVQFFSEGMSLLAEVNVSIQRIEDFMLLEEIKPSVKKLNMNSDSIIFMKNVKASWEKNSSTNNLCDINISFHPNKLYFVVGPVGSGKSSLLKLILGELQPNSGDVVVNGNVSYSSQEPWLFNSSIQDNILFGTPYDEKKYNCVVQACALTKDFKQMTHGDKTLVGERGMTLSGGQCARVNLARAVYRDADIYLFDDPLSAVDAHVGESLFQNCINGLLKDKTRILVTHQVQYLKEADVIILINNGKIEFYGTVQNFFENKEHFDQLPLDIRKEKSVEKNIDETAISLMSISNYTTNINEEKESKETEDFSTKGRIPVSLYLKYFKSGATYLKLSIVLMCCVTTQLLVSGFDYWSAFWTKQEEKRLKFFYTHRNETDLGSQKFLNRDTALCVYGGLLLGIIVLSNLRNILFFNTVLNSSKNIHNSMFSRLIRVPMQFFEVNFSGRIVNRFSKDTGAADEFLPISMLEVIERICFAIGVIIQILIINWWSFFPLLIMMYICTKINDIYLSTVQSIKRLETLAKSPIFTLVNSSLLGLLTIRSCQAQNTVQKEFDTQQDHHTSAHHLVLMTSTAFGFWFDIVSTFFLAFITYSFILINNNKSIYAGDVGLALTQSLTICGMLQFALKQIAEIVTLMVSVERMYQYTKLEQEGPFESEPGQVPHFWPSQGEVIFKNLQLRYSDKDKLVLKNLNLTIDPTTKVGIVGRTGAGKSSLISALFQLAKTEGSLFIDKINVKNIGLSDLRSRISIIPQEPILFTASLRYNLDPFQQYDDASLWCALEKVELNKIFKSLDYSIDQAGKNLSVGQRQLLCLARVILKKNNILVLDEATANVDPKTDDFIQKIIRTKFKSCTVLTIAHRLNTIMDSDKVLVMNNGEIVEFDQPHILLQQNDSHFSKLVQQSGNSLSQHIKTMSEKIFDENSKNKLKFNHNDQNYHTRL